MPWNDNEDGPWGGPKGNNGGSNPNNGRNQWNNPSGGNIDDIIKNAQNKMKSLLPENTFHVNFSHKSSNSREIILSNS